MAVFEIVTWEVRPGRWEEAIALAKDVKSVCQRVDSGLTSIRAANTVVAGDKSGQLVMIFEHTDLAAWGASIESEQNDPEFRALAKQYGADSPATPVSRAILTEVAL